MEWGQAWRANFQAISARPRAPAPELAACALDAGSPDKVELCAMAKRYVTDACYDVADQALQLHGGYGYLKEYGVEKKIGRASCRERVSSPV